jgi:hypothetical protein
MNDPNDSTSIIDDIPFSSSFLEFCAKVRNNESSILPEFGTCNPFNIRHLSEKEGIELADALLENTNVTYLEFETKKYTNSSAEAMAKYVCTSKSLQRIRWKGEREEMICCFLHAFQESTSLKEVHMDCPFIDGSSNLALENMLTHTQSLRSLSFLCQSEEDIDVAAVRSGLKYITTLQELTLEFSRCKTSISPILTSLRDHPSLRRLCLCGWVGYLTGLESVLLSDASKITELDIHRFYGVSPTKGLTS